MNRHPRQASEGAVPEGSGRATWLVCPALCGVLLLACAAPFGSMESPSSTPQGQPRRQAAAPEAGAPSQQRSDLEGGFYGPEPEVTPTERERQALESILRTHPAASTRLRLSASLTLAARELAKGSTRLRAALAAGYSFDPAPTVLLIRASSSQEIPAALARAVTIGQATQIGIGVLEQSSGAQAAVLLAHRAASLRPFPRSVPKGGRARLKGELNWLRAPRVFVTSPSGQVNALGGGRGRDFDILIPFEQSGRYLVEVIGSGPSGPEVAALLTVSCDGAPLEVLQQPSNALEKEPDSVAAAEAQVLAAIQATRARHQLPPLEASSTLAIVARQHSERMRKAGVLAHVLPGSSDAGARLRNARIPYRRVLENVALAESSLSAHRTAEESPAHLQSILDPHVTEVGIGIARGRLPSGGMGSYLTELFVEPLPEEPVGRLTPEALVREAIWRERARLGKPSLLSDPRLDELAREAARSMLGKGQPSGDELAQRALTLRRKVSAVDVFVAASPEEAARSPNLSDAQFKRIGVGVAQGDSAKYGAGRLWIAVVYTD